MKKNDIGRDAKTLEQYVDHQRIGLVLVFFECVERLFCTDAADEIFSWNFVLIDSGVRDDASDCNKMHTFPLYICTRMQKGNKQRQQPASGA